MPSLGRLWPHVTARRTWDRDGRPAWEFRFTTRRAVVTSTAAEGTAPALAPAPPVPPDLPDRSGPPGEPAEVGTVSSRGVRIGADELRIDEFHHRVAEPDIDFRELLAGPDIALALVELAADPDNEALHRRVVGRLAIARGWFRDGTGLDVSASRIEGEGRGRLLRGVFIWQVHGERDSCTYIVTPTLRARDLLKADPGLARALIRVACPRPDDACGELERRLEEAITRLGAAARAGVPAEPSAGRERDTAAVLEVRGTGGAISVPDNDSDDVAGRGRSEAERALSEELAELARKVGTAAVRPPGPRSDQPRSDQPRTDHEVRN